MRSNNKKYRVISLFTGCGGLDLGFVNAGFEVVWANDIDHAACETYRRNFGEHIYEGDIANFDIDAIPDGDIVIGGFPCQDFSVVSKQGGIETKRGNLYKFFVNVVERKQPLAFVAENVRGLLTANGGKAIEQIKKDFEACGKGYTLHAKVYNFANYGVPQLRHRLVMVGIRKDLKREFIPPDPTHTSNNYVTAEQAFKGVENAKFNNEKTKIRQKTADMLSQIPEGGNFTAIKDPKLMLNVRLPLSLIYRRLNRNKPSTTIVACGGGGTWGYHYEEPRPLTNRERARIQSFPDDFIFEGSNTEVRKQIGNAVPPLGIERIAERLLETLNTEGNLSANENKKK